MRAQDATHCKRNHPFTPENTYVCKRGYRNCRTCARERDRRWRGVEVACPDCGTVTKVSHPHRADRVFSHGTCRSCAMKRAAQERLPLSRTDEDGVPFVEWWLAQQWTPAMARRVIRGWDFEALVASTYDDDAMKEAA